MQVTPEMATKWLKGNSQNRSVRLSHVDYLAGEMKNNRWVLTHQGICVAEDGTLLDGQHRLLAVEQSGLTAEMMVTTGASKDVMPATDLGIVPRSVADTINMLDGVTESCIKTAACRSIVSICGYFQNYKTSLGLVRVVLDEAGPEIDFTCNALREYKPARYGWVVGTLAFCLMADKSCAEFIEKFGAGENLSRNDAAKALRDWIVNSSGVHMRKVYKRGAIECVCNAALNGINGNPVKQVKSGALGMDYFTNKNRGFVDQIRGQVSTQIKARLKVGAAALKAKRNEKAN